MTHGWTGTNLEVDLTQGTIQKVKGDPAVVRAYLGGKGLGIKMLWDRVPPETKPFSADNLIIITTGLLVDTPVPSANKCVMSFVSPVSETYHHCSMGGFFAAELKYAGYDNIIIRGKSSKPVYLWINNNQVELRDASHLWGKGTFDTRSIIRKELENEKIQITCIGQAGENKLFQAAVMGGTGASFSMAGPGAVWGDKKLKAIAVFGTNDVSLAHPTRLYEMSQDIWENAQRLTESRRGKSLFGTNRWEVRDVFYGNFNEIDYAQLPPDSELKKGVDKHEEKLAELVKSRGVNLVGCYNCRVHCRQTFPYRGELSPLKCSSLLSYLVYAKHMDYDWALDCYNMGEDWGLDIQSFPRTIAFAIDLYERGILTKEDTDGLHLEFGNPEAWVALMKKIVNREGIGDVLANGTLQAARQIGRGAEERAFVTKGRELRLTATFNYAPNVALASAVNTKDYGGQISGEVQRIIPKPWGGIVSGTKEAEEAYRNGGWYRNPKEIEDRKAYLEKGWFMYPKEYEEIFLHEYSRDYSDMEPEPFTKLLIYDHQHYSITDSLGLCHRYTGSGRNGFTSHAQLAALISHATGMNIDENELTTIAQRILNLARAFNLRRGLTRADDTVPKIYFERDPAPPRKKLDRNNFNKWLDTYYELSGWTKEGVPTRETLEKCGLGDVGQDLEQRGIIVEKEMAAPVKR